MSYLDDNMQKLGIFQGATVQYISKCHDHDNHADERRNYAPLIVGNTYTVEDTDKLSNGVADSVIKVKLKEAAWWVDLSNVRSISTDDTEREKILRTMRMKKVIDTIRKMNKEYAVKQQSKRPELAEIFYRDYQARMQAPQPEGAPITMTTLDVADYIQTLEATLGEQR